MDIPRNVSGVDRAIRIVAGIMLLLLVPLAFAGVFSPWAWLGLLGIPLAVSGILGFCVTYWVLGTGTAGDTVADGWRDRSSEVR